jgi:ubiquitin
MSFKILSNPKKQNKTKQNKTKQQTEQTRQPNNTKVIK